MGLGGPKLAQRQGCGIVESPEAGVCLLKETDSGPYLFYLDLCVILLQFILQLKFCLYMIVHLLLEKFRISLKSSLNAQSTTQQVLESESESRFFGYEMSGSHLCHPKVTLLQNGHRVWV